MEEQLLRTGVPLYSLETFTPLVKFDVLGFTLQYEIAFTNVLTSGMVGMMIGVTRLEAGYGACGVSSVGIFPCVTAIERDEDAEVARVLASRSFEEIKSLRRDQHQRDSTCWLHGREICISTGEPR